MNEYTRAQKIIITRLNTLKNKGGTGHKVRIATLRKNNLEHLLEEYGDFITKDENTKHHTSQPAQQQKQKQKQQKTLFTKTDVFEFLQTTTIYPCEKTRQTYLTAYDNSRHRKKNNPPPEFTSTDLLNYDFIQQLLQHNKGRFLLYPIPNFLRQNFYKDNKWAHKDFKTIKDNISTSLSKFYQHKEQETMRKNENTTCPVSKEELEEFYDTLITSDMDLMDTKQEKDYRTLARCLSILTVVQCRDDLGTMIINPNDDEKDTATWIELHTGIVSTIPKKKNTQRQYTTLPSKNLDYLRKDYERFPRKYLNTHLKDNTRPWGIMSSQFATMTEKYMGKKVVLNDIRKCYTSWSIKNGNSADIVEIARRQGHSLDTAIKHYNQNIPDTKLTKNDNNNDNDNGNLSATHAKSPNGFC